MKNFSVVPLLLLANIYGLDVIGITSTTHITGEYLMLSQGEDILRIHLSSGNLESLPITNLSIPSAIEFDSKRDCFLLSHYDNIERHCLDQNKSSMVMATYGLKDVDVLAYDWLSSLLYFSDWRGKIEAVSSVGGVSMTGHNYYMRRTVVIVGSEVRVHGLAVHPPMGYLYWTQHGANDAQNTSVCRANLDGSNAQVLIRPPQVLKPHSLAIDYVSGRMYWFDTVINNIGSCDLNGDDYHSDLKFNDEFISGISVLNDIIYWLQSSNDENHNRTTLMVYNLRTKTKSSLLSSTRWLRNLHVYGAESQTGTNLCNDESHDCTHVCVGSPGGEFRCLCPDGMTMTDSGACECSYGDEEQCLRNSNVCVGDQFKCLSDGHCFEA